MEFEETKSSNFSELDEYVEVAAPNEAKEDESLDSKGDPKQIIANWLKIGESQ